MYGNVCCLRQRDGRRPSRKLGNRLPHAKALPPARLPLSHGAVEQFQRQQLPLLHISIVASFALGLKYLDEDRTSINLLLDCHGMCC